MNKKLATLLFAIGLGAATSAFAIPSDDPTCDQQCGYTYMACKAYGIPMSECMTQLNECRDRCGI